MDMPSPVPFWDSLLLLRSWVNTSKICRWNSGVMPQPVSATAMVSWASRPDAATNSLAISVMVPPSGVNFTALDRMFMSTWLMRTSSPTRYGRLTPSQFRSKRMPRTSTGSRCMAHTFSIIPIASKGSWTSVTFPACSFDTSKMSFTSESRYWAALPSRLT